MQLLVLMKIPYFYNISGGSQKWQKNDLAPTNQILSKFYFLQTTVS